MEDFRRSWTPRTIATAGDDRTGRESHFRPASLVSSRPPSSARFAGTRFLRLERYRREISKMRGSSSPIPRRSNWTWDPVAKQYYWHRFFSHQPDLNFDNPRVVEEILKVMRFWLDMGVDALRMDAIPYLVERDGTSCENLPETHAVIKTLRTRSTRIIPTA